MGRGQGTAGERTHIRAGVLDAHEAQQLAERLHADSLDKMGLPDTRHLAAVAASVPEFARVVAWLHDAPEDGLVTYEELEARSISAVDLEALKLLNRGEHEGTYMDYIRAIAEAKGLVGVIVRVVKRADNIENQTRPCAPGMEDMRSPGGRYDRALRIIKTAMNERGETYSN